MDKFKIITDFYLKSQDKKKRSVLLYILKEFMDKHRLGCFDISDLNITVDNGKQYIEKIVLYQTGMFNLRTPTFQMYDIDWITDDVLEDIILKFMEAFLGYENETCFNSTDDEVVYKKISIDDHVINIIDNFIMKNDYDCEVHLYSNFYNGLGFDSLDMVELAMEIEKEFNIELDDDNIKTVEDLINIVKRKLRKNENRTMV